MGRRKSKANLILEEARKPLEELQRAVAEALAQLESANFRLAAYEAAYASVERVLTATSRPKPVQPAAKKSKTVATTETGKATATPATKCAVPNCGLPESAAIHDVVGGEHIFHAKIKVKGKPIVLPDDPETYVHEASA